MTNSAKATKRTAAQQAHREILSECLAAQLAQQPELETLLLEDHASARSRWPEFKLPFRSYISRVAEILEGGASLTDHPHRQELFLALACADNDPQALSLLEQDYLPKIKVCLTRYSSDPQQLDDLLQIVREHLLIARAQAKPVIAQYSGLGKLESWLRVVAIRLAINNRRSRSVDHTQVLSEKLKEALPSRCPDPELSLLKETYHKEFSLAFKAAVASIDSRDRAVLTFNLVDGLHAAQIAEIYDVHRTTVVRWLAKAQSRVIEQTMERMKLSLSVADDELDSIFRLIQSQVSLSL